MNDHRHYLSTRAAADYLGLSSRTLDRYRVSGEGPVFHRFGGRVRYTRSDLDAWAKARRRVSTSDDGSVLEGGGTVNGPRIGRGHRAARALGVAAVAAAALAGGTDWALATTDTTFDGPLDTVTGMVSGTGGQLAAALAVAAALVGSVLRFNAMQILGAVGVGVAAGAGTGIVTGLVGTAIV